MGAAFDPTIPVADSQIDSLPLRNNFNALNGLIEGVQGNLAGLAPKPTGVSPISTPISNPPTQAEVEELRDKYNELLAALNS